MKIKCVECPEMVNNETEFFHHMNEKHGFYSIHILYNLIFKIHEVMEDGRTLNVVVDVLKSLLEDDGRYLPASANKGFESLYEKEDKK